MQSGTVNGSNLLQQDQRFSMETADRFAYGDMRWQQRSSDAACNRRHDNSGTIPVSAVILYYDDRSNSSLFRASGGFKVGIVNVPAPDSPAMFTFHIYSSGGISKTEPPSVGPTQRIISMKTAPMFLTLRLSGLFSAFVFVATSPNAISPKASGQLHKLRLASPHHGNFTPARFSAGRPHCVIPLARGCGWTNVLYLCCYGDAIRHGLLFGRDGSTLAPYILAVFLWRCYRHRWSSRIPRCRSPHF